MDEENKKKAKDLFINNIVYVLLAILCTAYILYGFLNLDESGKTIGEILKDGAVVLIFSIVITKLFGFQGLNKGAQTQEMTEARAKHAATVVSVGPILEYLDEFCTEENRLNLINTRKFIISSNGYKHSDFLDEGDNLKELTFKKLSRAEKRKEQDCAKGITRERLYHKLKNLKLTKVSPKSLLTENDKVEDEYNFGTTMQQYMLRADVSGIALKVVSVVLFAYYGISVINNFSVGALIWSILQVVLFLSMGLLKFFLDYLFMKNSYSQRILNQESKLNVFKNKYKDKNKLCESAVVQPSSIDYNLITAEVLKRIEVEE